MPTFVALLRAVNVGGTGKLPMADLRALCVASGLIAPRTYIASGNVVFDSDGSAAAAGRALEAALAGYAGRPVGVFVRTAEEMLAVRDANPFPAAAPNRTLVIFLDRAPPEDLLDTLRGCSDEEVHPGRREIYVHYGDGMAKSKLVIPAAAVGTARNMNTVTKLAAMVSDE